jgi:hypothetical protein
VTSLRLQYSDDNIEYHDVQDGEVFETGLTDDSNDDRFYVRLSQTVKSRYFKIIPVTWVGHISLRAGFLTSTVEGSK